jgi:hypothetical protein
MNNGARVVRLRAGQFPGRISGCGPRDRIDRPAA